jgi:hypothetical protein
MKGKTIKKQKQETLPYPRCVEGCCHIEDGKCVYRRNHVDVAAVDMDKTLFYHEKWEGHEHFGELMPDAKWGLEELRRMGFKIMIWTTRRDKDLIEAQLKKYDLPYDYINENPNQAPDINPTKPVANYYIDDCGVHHTGWVKTITEIKQRQQTHPYYPEYEV